MCVCMCVFVHLRSPAGNKKQKVGMKYYIKKEEVEEEEEEFVSEITCAWLARATIIF